MVDYRYKDSHYVPHYINNLFVCTNILIYVYICIKPRFELDSTTLPGLLSRIILILVLLNIFYEFDISGVLLLRRCLKPSKIMVLT